MSAMFGTLLPSKLLSACSTSSSRPVLAILVMAVMGHYFCLDTQVGTHGYNLPSFMCAWQGVFSIWTITALSLGTVWDEGIGGALSCFYSGRQYRWPMCCLSHFAIAWTTWMTYLIGG